MLTRLERVFEVEGFDENGKLMNELDVVAVSVAEAEDIAMKFAEENNQPPAHEWRAKVRGEPNYTDYVVVGREFPDV